MDALELVYRGVWTLVFIGIAAGITALAWGVIRFNLKRRAVARSLAEASTEQLDKVLGIIESISSEPSVGGVLVRTNEPVSADAVVAIPEGIFDFPWAGQSVVMKFDAEPHLSLEKGNGGDTRLSGHRYRYLAVPREKTGSGKLRNIFDPSRYLKLAPGLAAAVEEICPEHPKAALSAILCNGQIQFEPIDQLRIGTSDAWIQTPDWQSCDKCRKRLKLILQLPGVCMDEKQLREGTIYLFGCGEHPEETKQVVQHL